ncbi:AraC family transcriptional regulator [Paenibacillus phytorum]|nr:helix-turn-helix domain-containing protein [Paenibacillus phytorum]
MQGRLKGWKQLAADRRKSVFLTLIISYMIILLLPVTLGGFFYTRIEAIMIENANSSNTAMLEQVKRTIDSRMKEIDQLTQQIAFHPKLLRMLDQRGDGDAQQNLTSFIDFMGDMSRYSKVNSFIADSYVYFNNSDIVLSPKMKTDSHTLYQGIYNYQNLTYDQYKKQILLPYHSRFFNPSEEMTDGQGNSIRMITYVQSLPIGEKEHVAGAFVILINEKQITEMLANIQGIGDETVFILDADGTVLMSTAESDQENGEIISYLKKLGGGLSGKGSLEYAGTGQVKGQGQGLASDMMVAYTTSSQNGWTYVSVVHKAIVLSQVNAIKMWAITVVMICLAAGGVVCYYMAYRHYRPIRDLVHAVVRGGGTNSTAAFPKNEFELIKEKVHTLFEKEKDLETTLSRHALVVRTEFLSRLIRGHVDAAALTEQDLDFMNVHFESGLFAVLLLDIDDFSEFSQQNAEREWALMRFILSNVSVELLEHKSYLIEMERDRIAILVNLPAGDGCDTRMEAFVVNLKDMMEKRFKTKLSISVSDVHEGIERIQECYNEAVFAMAYKMIKGQNTVLYYEDVQKFGQSTYYYPMEMEVQLMNVARSGDFVNVEKILNRIYEVNFQSGGITPEMGKCLFFDMFSSVLKLLGSLNIARNLVFNDESDPVRIISKCATAEQMVDQIKRLYKQLCEVVQEERTDHGEQLYRKMTDYMQEHFHDSMLSLTMMADHFGMNASYLSAFYKNYSGRNVSDEMTEMRLNACKRLLAESTLTVSEIAQQVGYSSNIGLTRVFKKAEGITPGQYRSAMNHESG